MNHTSPPNLDYDLFFHVVSDIAHCCATTSDLQEVLTQSITICIESFGLSGAVVWLRAREQAMIAPGISRLPSGSSTSAISEDDSLIQRVLSNGVISLHQTEAQSLVVLPEQTDLALAPIQSEGFLLGLIGFLGHPATLPPLCGTLETCANVLSGALVNNWLRRQQAEADTMAQTLLQFAAELRSRRSLGAILTTLNDLAARVFNCDWSAVYLWEDAQFQPIQARTRTGEQPLSDEPCLRIEDNPVLEVVMTDPQMVSLHDLREQPNALPTYLEHHDVRGVILIPLQQTPGTPLGLLAVGYWVPLIPLGHHLTSLAPSLARMVAVALERERERARQHHPSK